MSEPDLWPQLVQLVHAYALRRYGRRPIALALYLHEGERPTYEPLPPVSADGRTPGTPAASTGEKFTPTEFQMEIWEALEFRALRSDALAAALDCDRRKLWKPGGIKEMVEAGWVKLDSLKRLGYYRPDAPPDELTEGT